VLVIDGLLAGYLRLSTAVIRVVATVVMLAMTGVSALEIGARALFGVSFSGAQEVSVLAAMWVYFFSYALIAKQHDYLRVEFLVALFPPIARRIIGILVRLIVVLFYGTVGWFAIQAAGFLALFHTDVLELPEYFLVIPLMLGAIDIALTEFIHLVWQLRGRPVPGDQTAATAHA
jgi:TRAP-type C4-dicarboxylate transport system permease small subunit